MLLNLNGYFGAVPASADHQREPPAGWEVRIAVPATPQAKPAPGHVGEWHRIGQAIALGHKRGDQLRVPADRLANGHHSVARREIPL